MSYYDRKGTVVRLDGSRHFHTQQDIDHETEVAALASKAWGCEFRRFGTLTPIDWYAIREGRMSGLAELKSRHHSADKYPNAWLNVRKWLALMMGAAGLGVPAVYIVRFTDQVLWVPVAEIDGTMHRMAGCTHIVKSVNDIEPIIYIPLSLFRPLPQITEE